MHQHCRYALYPCWLTEIESQGSSTYSPVHIINVEVKDNQEDATLGAFLVLELCDMVGYLQEMPPKAPFCALCKFILFLLFVHQMREAGDLENEMEDIIQEFELKNKRTLLHTVAFY